MLTSWSWPLIFWPKYMAVNFGYSLDFQELFVLDRQADRGGMDDRQGTACSRQWNIISKVRESRIVLNTSIRKACTVSRQQRRLSWMRRRCEDVDSFSLTCTSKLHHIKLVNCRDRCINDTDTRLMTAAWSVLSQRAVVLLWRVSIPVWHWLHLWTRLTKAAARSVGHVHAKFYDYRGKWMKFYSVDEDVMRSVLYTLADSLLGMHNNERRILKHGGNICAELPED